MHIHCRDDSTLTVFFRRTIAAQIHMLALPMAGLGMLLLLPKARAMGTEHFWACLTFLVSGSAVFGTSSAYHFLHDGFRVSPKLELFLENLDHCCIYLFIAGTYTPILLNAIEPPWRTYLMMGIWGIAFLGIAYALFKSYLPALLQSRGVYTALFVIMGLLFIFRFGEISNHLSKPQLGSFFAGSLAYLLGAVGYAIRRPKLLVGTFGYHELWHVMVLLGACSHFLLIYSFY